MRKAEQLLDAIGEVDEELLADGFWRKRKRRPWLGGVIAACVTLAVALPVALLGNGRKNSPLPTNGVYSQKDRSNEIGEIGDIGEIENIEVRIYSASGGKLTFTDMELPGSAESVFDAWKTQNGVGEEVKLLRTVQTDNGETTVSNGVATHTVGDHFVTRVAVSENIRDYYTEPDGGLLLDSLRRTLEEFTRTGTPEQNEFYLTLEPASA